MIPVDQTKIHSETVQGNCFTACVASYFEMQIDELPDFYCDNWIINLSNFVKNLGYDWDYYDLTRYPEYGLPNIDDYIIVSGDSPRFNDIGHSVIYKDGVMVHDPHPSKAGIGRLRGYWLFTKFNK